MQLFAGRQIRTCLDDNEEKYYFCIIDAVEALTDNKNPADYFKKLRKQFISSDGKRHNPKCIDIQGLLRIIQSIPPKKAELFKRWFAQIGADRRYQMQDPELGSNSRSRTSSASAIPTIGSTKASRVFARKTSATI